MTKEEQVGASVNQVAGESAEGTASAYDVVLPPTGLLALEVDADGWRVVSPVGSEGDQG